MLTRAWYLFAGLWACLLTWLLSRQEQPAVVPVLIAYGPLAAPWAMRHVVGWLRHGFDHWQLRTVPAKRPVRRQQR